MRNEVNQCNGSQVMVIMMTRLLLSNYLLMVLH